MSNRRVLWAVLLGVLLVTSGCAQLRERFQPVQNQGPGALYEDYLGGDAQRLVVELDHEPGALWASDTEAQQDFVDQLELITNKEVIVRTDADLPEQGTQHTYTMAKLEQLHAQYQDVSSNEERVVMHALFLNGDSISQDGEDRGDVAGIAYDADAFALFEGAIQQRTCANGATVCQVNGNPSVQKWKVMRAVAIHEAGHLFGLVNSPLPMVTDHEMEQDPNPDTAQNEGDAHSSNEESVMWWQVESVNQLDSLADAQSLIGGGDVPWEFDANDLKDARAVRQDGG